MTPFLDQAITEVRGSWRYRWIAVAVAWTITLIGWLVVLAMPDIYKAEASIFVDTRTALKPVLQGIAVDQDIGGQLNFARQSLLARPELERIALQCGVVTAADTDPYRRARKLDNFRDFIYLEVRSGNGREDQQETAGSIYTLAYQDGSRERAVKVVDALLKSLVTETLGGKREGSADAQQFLEVQIKEYENRLRQAEDRLAEFKKSNVTTMPSQEGGYFNQLQTEMDNVDKARAELSVAEARRTELARQLRADAILASGPFAGPTLGAPAGSQAVDTLTRIQETQAKLDGLLLRFTDKHPEVIATKNELEELKQRRESEIEALKRGDTDAAARSGIASNPVYQSIQLALNQVDVEIASLKGQLMMRETKVASLKKLLNTMPQVEADYAQLNRDYDVNKAQYTQLLERLQKARLGERADDTGSVRFEVVQPPNASFTPVSPKRSMLMAALLLAGIAAGCLVAYMLHTHHPVFETSQALTQTTGLHVLGVVSLASPAKHSTAAMWDRALLGAAVGALILGLAALVALHLQGPISSKLRQSVIAPWAST